MVFGAREGFVEAPLTLSEPRASLRAAMMGWGLGLNPRRLSLILTSLHEHGLSPLHVGSAWGGGSLIVTCRLPTKTDPCPLLLGH